MKEKKILLFLFIFIGILIVTCKVNASSGTTYFYGEPLSIEKQDDIEILLNELKIDAENSRIKNIFLIKNIQNQPVETRIEMLLENKDLSTTINSLEILVNNSPINYERCEDGKNTFTIKLEENEAVKIEFNYKTDNNLRDSKIIKYSLDNLQGRVVKALKVDIVLPEEDIPLVKNIYPQIYELNGNTVHVEYYNFKVNSLTKDVILEKDTYKDIMYGQETTYKDILEEQEGLLSDEDREIITKSRTWINEGIKIDYDDNSIYGKHYGFYLLRNYEYEEKEIPKAIYMENFLQKYLNHPLEEKSHPTLVFSVFQYAITKQLVKDNKSDIMLIEYYSDIFNGKDWNYPLTGEYVMLNSNKDLCPLINRKICIDYVESEGDKQLYVSKLISGYEETAIYEYVIESELEILKTKDLRPKQNSQPGARFIYVGQGINGEKLDATEEEKVEYVNMINADLYLRYIIYDKDFNKVPETEKTYAIIGYYSEDNKEIGEKYANIAGNTEYWKHSNISISNDYIAKYSKVPTLAQCVGFRSYEDGKYIVNYFWTINNNGLYYAWEALETIAAKNMILENRNRNAKIKDDIENEISKINIIKEEISTEEKKQEVVKLSKQNIIVLSIIIISILICIIMLIINIGRKERGNK